MYTEILLNKMKAYSEELGKCRKRIRQEQEEIHEVQRVLKTMQGNGLQEVVFRLQKQIQNLEREDQKIEMLRTALLKIISLYENCEKKILSLEDGKRKQYSEEFRTTDLNPYKTAMNNLGIHFYTGS